MGTGLWCCVQGNQPKQHLAFLFLQRGSGALYVDLFYLFIHNNK